MTLCVGLFCISILRHQPELFSHRKSWKKVNKNNDSRSRKASEREKKEYCDVINFPLNREREKILGRSSFSMLYLHIFLLFSFISNEWVSEGDVCVCVCVPVCVCDWKFIFIAHYITPQKRSRRRENSQHLKLSERWWQKWCHGCSGFHGTGCSVESIFTHIAKIKGKPFPSPPPQSIFVERDDDKICASETRSLEKQFTQFSFPFFSADCRRGSFCGEGGKRREISLWHLRRAGFSLISQRLPFRWLKRKAFQHENIDFRPKLSKLSTENKFLRRNYSTQHDTPFSLEWESERGLS